MNGPIIIGGGPAGAAAAIALTEAGVQATLYERQSHIGDAICGGFLSWRTLAQIEALGVTQDSLGGAKATHLSLFLGNRHWSMALPAPAMGLSRQRLDTLLLARAEQCGADIQRGVSVQMADEWRITLDSGDSIEVDTLFLATGKYELRGLTRPRDAAGDDPELGLRMRLPPCAALDALVGEAIEIHLFDRGYLGINRQEDGSANACMAVRKSRLIEAGSPIALFTQLADASPAIAARLDSAASMPPVDAIAHVPYGWRARTTTTGIFRLGDQAGVIPSLAGEGMGIALASASAAVSHWRSGGPDAALAYQQAFARNMARPVTLAHIIKEIGTRPQLARVPVAVLAAIPGAAAMIARLTRIA